MGTRGNRPNEAIQTCTHDLCFSINKQISHFFTAVKNRSLLHRRFIVVIHDGFCERLLQFYTSKYCPSTFASIRFQNIYNAVSESLMCVLSHPQVHM